MDGLDKKTNVNLKLQMNDKTRKEIINKIKKKRKKGCEIKFRGKLGDE